MLPQAGCSYPAGCPCAWPLPCSGWEIHQPVTSFAYESVTMPSPAFVRLLRLAERSASHRFERASRPISHRQSGLVGELLERGFRPGTEMADHLGGRERAEPCRGFMIDPARKPEQEAGCKQIAGPGGVDHARHRESRHRLDDLRAHHHAAALA